MPLRLPPRLWACHQVGPLPLIAPSFLALQACSRSTARNSGQYTPEQGHVGHPETCGPQSIQPQAPGGGWGRRGPARTGAAPAALHWDVALGAGCPHLSSLPWPPWNQTAASHRTGPGGSLDGGDGLQALGPAWTMRARTEGLDRGVHSTGHGLPRKRVENVSGRPWWGLSRLRSKEGQKFVKGARRGAGRGGGRRRTAQLSRRTGPGQGVPTGSCEGRVPGGRSSTRFPR